MWRFLLFGVCLFLFNSFTLAQPMSGPATNPSVLQVDPNAPPSITDLQQMLDDKKYQAVIQQTSKLLLVTGPGATTYNRFDLLKLKAEAQLEHGDTESALSVLSELARKTNDPHDRDVAQATILLIHRSPRGKYIPKTLPAGLDRAEPIDIYDPLTRKAAFEAMFNDDRQTIEPRVNSAEVAQSIPPILPVIDSILRLRSLDVAASGTDQRTSDLTTKLVDHVKTLMTNALDQMTKRVDEIAKLANTETVTTQMVVVQGIPSPVETRTKQGLTAANIGELRGMVSTCEKIIPVAQSLTKVGNTQVDMQDVLTKSNDVHSKASDLLNTRF